MKDMLLIHESIAQNAMRVSKPKTTLQTIKERFISQSPGNQGNITLSEKSTMFPTMIHHTIKISKSLPTGHTKVKSLHSSQVIISKTGHMLDEETRDLSDQDMLGGPHMDKDTSNHTLKVIKVCMIGKSRVPGEEIINETVQMMVTSTKVL